MSSPMDSRETHEAITHHAVSRDGPAIAVTFYSSLAVILCHSRFFFILAEAFLFSFAAELPHIIVNAWTLRKPFPTFVAINVPNFPFDV